MKYTLTPADRAPLPETYVSEDRYLGYRDADREQPYSRFFERTTRPVLDHVVRALVAGMSPTEYGYGVDEVASRLGRSGYEPMETGWTRLGNGIIHVAALTPMPGVTAAMWDWWFGWHSRETARYKLWYPDAHQFSAIGDDRSADRTLSDRQRYVDNVSYVDEYIGGQLQRLAIRFFDAGRMGFDESAGTTHICARVSLSSHPIAIGWLVHQVRPVDDGVEMRSRFFLNDPEVLDLPRRSLPSGLVARGLSSPLGRAIASPVVPTASEHLLPDSLGTDMIFHCASEMHHLAAFLPELHAECADVP